MAWNTIRRRWAAAKAEGVAGALASRSKTALAWFSMLALACAALWGAGSKPEGGADEAQALAARAVEWSVAGETAKLSAAMTPEALERALYERKAARLDESLARAGATVKARASALQAERIGGRWEARGLVQAIVGAGSAPWRGAWIARMDQDERGELRVSWLRMVSLPEAAPFDASSLPLASQP